MIYPRKASHGATIGIAAVSSMPAKKDVSQGIKNLRKMGYNVVDFTKTLKKNISDLQRIQILHRALSDKSVEVIVMARGGYGGLRVLDKIDYRLISRSRKIMVGFSDFTAVSLAIFKKTKLITFSGPMLRTHFAGTLSKLTRESFRDNIHGFIRKEESIDLKKLGGKTLMKGSAPGFLLGGNLAVLCHLIGTEYLPDFTDAILFIEDVDEHAGRLGNALAQLRNSGLLKKVGGILAGQFTNCFKGSKTRQLSEIRALLKDYTDDLNIPVMYDIPFGHESKIITMPVGLPVRLDSDKGKLTYLETPVE
jgi:muramoyltetrapeptide carboxypeptidase